MGGQILKLRSEEILEEGIQKGMEKGMQIGMEKGKTLAIYDLVQNRDISPECGAKHLGITVPDLKEKMADAGYRYSES